MNRKPDYGTEEFWDLADYEYDRRVDFIPRRNDMENVTRVTIDIKKLVADIETEDGAFIKITFPWDMGYDKLQKAVSVLSTAILEEFARTK